MDVNKILAGLREELRQVNQVIASLEQLTQGRRRPGRPRGSKNKTANRPTVFGPQELMTPPEAELSRRPIPRQ